MLLSGGSRCREHGNDKALFEGVGVGGSGGGRKRGWEGVGVGGSGGGRKRGWEGEGMGGRERVVISSNLAC